MEGLARRLGYSERHLNRQLREELGAGPQATARAQRAQTARLLIETTALPFSEVALAAGFSSIRQFNDTVRLVFATTPTDLRSRRNGGDPDTAPGAIVLRLPYRKPFDGRVLSFLGERAVPQVEAFEEGVYRRSLALGHGAATVALKDAGGHVTCSARIQDLQDLGAPVQRCRRLLDLDSDPAAVDEQLATDPLLRPLIVARPGMRIRGTTDATELAVRAVLGQQVSVGAPRTLASSLAHPHGRPLPEPDGSLTHLFPNPESIADSDLAEIGMPSARKRALKNLARAIAGEEVALHPGVDRAEAMDSLVALPGIGPWTAQYVAMRALGDPDIFLATDLGARRGLERLGRPGDPRSALQMGESWRPWRSYALQHLWASIETPREEAA